MQKDFYSNGKLLLSGEYAILDDALGLALPTKYGQSLRVTSTSSEHLEWVSLDDTGVEWFAANFALKDLVEISSSDQAISKALEKLLLQARLQNPDFLPNQTGLKVVTKLGFPRFWGLGTSSTLINNIAQWAEVDAYQLLWKAFGGSGYDIACAKHNSPILYQLENDTPKVEEVAFNPPFKDAIYFVYLNQKQSSKEAIAAYRKKEFNPTKLLQDITGITQKMTTANSLSEFEALMTTHEEVLSPILGIQPIKSQLFADYSGAIKSLGAWGGDFIMVTGNEKTADYFKSKGYKTIIPYTHMALS